MQINKVVPERNQDDAPQTPADKLAAEDVRTKKLRNDIIEQDLKERKLYAHRIFSLIATWLSVLGIIIVLQGIIENGFNLSEPVLLAVVGGTTANVLGMFYVVLKYLFPKWEEEKTKNS